MTESKQYGNLNLINSKNFKFNEVFYFNPSIWDNRIHGNCGLRDWGIFNWSLYSNSWTYNGLFASPDILAKHSLLCKPHNIFFLEHRKFYLNSYFYTLYNIVLINNVNSISLNNNKNYYFLVNFVKNMSILKSGRLNRFFKYSVYKNWVISSYIYKQFMKKYIIDEITHRRKKLYTPINLAFTVKRIIRDLPANTVYESMINQFDYVPEGFDGDDFFRDEMDPKDNVLYWTRDCQKFWRNHYTPRQMSLYFRYLYDNDLSSPYINEKNSNSLITFLEGRRYKIHNVTLNESFVKDPALFYKDSRFDKYRYKGKFLMIPGNTSAMRLSNKRDCLDRRPEYYNRYYLWDIFINSESLWSSYASVVSEHSDYFDYMMQTEYMNFNSKLVFNAEIPGKNKIFIKLWAALENTYSYIDEELGRDFIIGYSNSILTKSSYILKGAFDNYALNEFASISLDNLNNIKTRRLYNVNKIFYNKYDPYDSLAEKIYFWRMRFLKRRLEFYNKVCSFGYINNSYLLSYFEHLNIVTNRRRKYKKNQNWKRIYKKHTEPEPSGPIELDLKKLATQKKKSWYTSPNIDIFDFLWNKEFKIINMFGYAKKKVLNELFGSLIKKNTFKQLSVLNELNLFLNDYNLIFNKVSDYADSTAMYFMHISNAFTIVISEFIIKDIHKLSYYNSYKLYYFAKRTPLLFLSNMKCEMWSFEKSERLAYKKVKSEYVRWNIWNIPRVEETWFRRVFGNRWRDSMDQILYERLVKFNSRSDKKSKRTAKDLLELRRYLDVWRKVRKKWIWNVLGFICRHTIVRFIYIIRNYIVVNLALIFHAYFYFLTVRIKIFYFRRLNKPVLWLIRLFRWLGLHFAISLYIRYVYWYFRYFLPEKLYRRSYFFGALYLIYSIIWVKLYRFASDYVNVSFFHSIRGSRTYVILQWATYHLGFKRWLKWGHTPIDYYSEVNLKKVNSYRFRKRRKLNFFFKFIINVYLFFKKSKKHEIFKKNPKSVKKSYFDINSWDKFDVTVRDFKNYEDLFIRDPFKDKDSSNEDLYIKIIKDLFKSAAQSKIMIIDSEPPKEWRFYKGRKDYFWREWLYMWQWDLQNKSNIKV